MIRTDEDDEFERVAHEAKMKGQSHQVTSRRDDDDDIQEYVRPWVGLTDDERDGKRVLENGLLFNLAEVEVWELAVQWAEAKLKEKNT